MRCSIARAHWILSQSTFYRNRFVLAEELVYRFSANPEKCALRGFVGGILLVRCKRIHSLSRSHVSILVEMIHFIDFSRLWVEMFTYSDVHISPEIQSRWIKGNAFMCGRASLYGRGLIGSREKNKNHITWTYTRDYLSRRFCLNPVLGGAKYNLVQGFRYAAIAIPWSVATSAEKNIFDR